jgi:hypothetical protein
MAKSKNDEKQYGALRGVAQLYRAAGILTLAGTFLAIFMYILGSSPYSYGPDIFSIVMLLVTGGITAMSLYAVGQLIELLLEMGENTREQVWLLERISRDQHELLARTRRKEVKPSNTGSLMDLVKKK